jgi:predicted Ser/Thr protein kinase
VQQPTKREGAGQPVTARFDPVPGMVVAEKYRVDRVLGEGGMGVVYLAQDPRLNRMVAIKMLSGQGDSVYDREIRERFAREAQSAAALKHAHIVTIYDVGEDHGRPFIAMEFLEGESMADLIGRRAPLDVERKAGLILQLCFGLGYAHRQGIIHRDIKPANLMISHEGTLKILDFGLARVAASVTQAALTQVGTVIGTPNYMSPEQILGEQLDHRSDVFSVGAVLYELLTYRTAFAADTAQLVLFRILQAQPTPVREIVPDIDPAFERVVAKALEKDRERRYESLSALASDLEHAVSWRGERDQRTVQLAAGAARAVETDAGGRERAPSEDAAPSAPVDRTVLVGAVRRTTRPSRRPALVAIGVIIAALCAIAAYALLSGRLGAGRGSVATGPGPGTSNGQTGTTSNPASVALPDSRVPDRGASSAPATSGAPPPPAAEPGGRGTAAKTPAGANGAKESAGSPSAGQPKPVSPAVPELPKGAALSEKCRRLKDRFLVGDPLTVTEQAFMKDHCRN